MKVLQHESFSHQLCPVIAVHLFLGQNIEHALTHSIIHIRPHLSLYTHTHYSTRQKLAHLNKIHYTWERITPCTKTSHTNISHLSSPQFTHQLTKRQLQSFALHLICFVNGPERHINLNSVHLSPNPCIYSVFLTHF